MVWIHVFGKGGTQIRIYGARMKSKDFDIWATPIEFNCNIAEHHIQHSL